MSLNLEKLELLKKDYGNDNYNKFAKILDIDVGYLHRVINCKANAGIKFISKLIIFCKKNDLDFNEYIFCDLC